MSRENGALRVLLLEDSPTDAELLAARLRSAGLGIDLTRVDSREEFAAVVGGDFDAIIADFRLPGFDALEALDIVAEQGVATPVVIVTGAVGEEVAVECMKRGATDYLLKDRLTRLPQALEQAVEQRELREAAEEARREMRRAHEETIRRLTLAVDSRSEETGQHILRIGTIAGRLAERLGLPPDEVEYLPLAASMHDVGKIGIPDAILAKPGPLTDEERTAMQRHTEIGHQILAGSGSELLELAAEIALTHHEWWDGNGYPRGLSGEEIPMAGRITAVADVFDALTSDRVYRPAIPEPEVIEMLTAARGTHFAPEVLDAFLELHAQGAFSDLRSGEGA